MLNRPCPGWDGQPCPRLVTLPTVRCPAHQALADRHAKRGIGGARAREGYGARWQREARDRSPLDRRARRGLPRLGPLGARVDRLGGRSRRWRALSPMQQPKAATATRDGDAEWVASPSTTRASPTLRGTRQGWTTPVLAPVDSPYIMVLLKGDRVESLTSRQSDHVEGSAHRRRDGRVGGIGGLQGVAISSQIDRASGELCLALHCVY